MPELSNKEYQEMLWYLHSIETRLESFIGEHQQADQDRDKRLDEHHKTLYGNGRPGIKTHVIFLYCSIVGVSAALGYLASVIKDIVS